jgi:hypothetical protein
MVRAGCESLQLGARHTPDGDVGVTRYFKNLSQARLVRALGQSQALDWPRARAQGFQYGLNAEDVRAVVFRAQPSRRFVVRDGHLRAVRPLFTPRAVLFTSHIGLFTLRSGYFTSRFGLFSTHTVFVAPYTGLVTLDMVLVAVNMKVVAPDMVSVSVNMKVIASDTGLVTSYTGLVAVNMTFVTPDTESVESFTGLVTSDTRVFTPRTEFVTLLTGLVAPRTGFAAALEGARDAVAGSFARAAALRVARVRVAPAMRVAVARAVARPLVVWPLLHKLFARERRARRERRRA